MDPEPLRAVVCSTCGYLALRRTDDVIDLGAAMVPHMEQAGCDAEGLMAHPLDAPERLAAVTAS